MRLCYAPHYFQTVTTLRNPSVEESTVRHTSPGMPSYTIVASLPWRPPGLYAHLTQLMHNVFPKVCASLPNYFDPHSCLLGISLGGLDDLLNRVHWRVEQPRKYPYIPPATLAMVFTLPPLLTSRRTLLIHLS